MLWLIQNIIFSISLIVVIHYLYIYFETTLTAPKVKDLDNVKSAPAAAHSAAADSEAHSDNLGIHSYNTNDIIPTSNTKSTNDMKTDLKTFLRGIGLKSSNDKFRPSYEPS
jgi:hypothetical protein